MKPERQLASYSAWIDSEGIPVHREFAVDDVRAVDVGPWQRLGGLGAYVVLDGAEERTGMYVCEIPPRGYLEPEVHLFEAVCYIVDGRGCTEFWRSGEPPQTVEWQRGSVFALPLNGWHRFVNLTDQPARYMAITNAPLLINLFQNTEFVYGERFKFNDRYRPEDGYFSSDPKPAVTRYGEVVYENNFIHDVRAIKLDHPPEGTARGEGYQRRYLKMGGNRMLTFASEYPVGTYTTGHWHDGGTHIYIARGRGFTLMWPPEAGMRPWEAGNADAVKRIDYHDGTVYAPPTGWWHQHFNTGNEPVRYVPSGSGFIPRRADGRALVYTSVRDGGHQIDYDLEDPHIRTLFQEALATR